MLHPGVWTQGPAAKLRLPSRICIILSANSDLQYVENYTKYDKNEDSEVHCLTGQDGRYQTFAGSRCHNLPRTYTAASRASLLGPLLFLLSEHRNSSMASKLKHRFNRISAISVLVLLAASGYWQLSNPSRSATQGSQPGQGRSGLHSMSSSMTTEEYQGLYDELGISKQIDGLEKIELLKKLECT